MRIYTVHPESGTRIQLGPSVDEDEFRDDCAVVIERDGIDSIIEVNPVAAIVAWLRTTPRAGGLLLGVEHSQTTARIADAIERGEWRKP